MIVVSNTTPLIGLASIQRFDLLKQLFSVIRPELEQLRQRGFSISQAIIEAILRQANE